MESASASSAEVVEEFLRCLEKGTLSSFDLVSPDVVADIVVPDWRFRCEGPEQLRAEVFADLQVPAEILELDRLPTATGEVLTVTFRADRGESTGPHLCRQAWVFTVEDGLATKLECFCGGEWYGPRLAEMAAAAKERGVAPSTGFVKG